MKIHFFKIFKGKIKTQEYNLSHQSNEDNATDMGLKISCNLMYSLYIYIYIYIWTDIVDVDVGLDTVSFYVNTF